MSGVGNLPCSESHCRRPLRLSRWLRFWSRRRRLRPRPLVVAGVRFPSQVGKEVMKLQCLIWLTLITTAQAMVTNETLMHWLRGAHCREMKNY